MIKEDNDINLILIEDNVNGHLLVWGEIRTTSVLQLNTSCVFLAPMSIVTATLNRRIRYFCCVYQEVFVILIFLALIGILKFQLFSS